MAVTTEQIDNFIASYFLGGEDEVDERIDERISDGDYIGDYEDDGYDNMHDWYTDYGRGEVEGEIVDEIVSAIAKTFFEDSMDFYYKDTYGDINAMIFSHYPQLDK